MFWWYRVEQSIDDVNLWRQGWLHYLERNIRILSRRFEQQKDFVVDMLMARRGMYQRPFMHFSLGILFMVGVLAGPILADTYPSGRDNKELAQAIPASAVATTLDLTDSSVKTQVSEKPPDQVFDYKVAAGDTLSTIADKFGVSTDSVRWANNMDSDMLSIGEVLKIPPVTGVVYKVKEGDTIYTIAKKYKTDAQNILNYPFNDFADLDTYALTVGQTLIVPGGVMPQSVAYIPPQQASLPTSLSPGAPGGSGQLLWPTVGIITQYPVWYHKAFDIANPSAPPIMAANAGTVIVVKYLKYDYGQHVIIDHGGGISTLYGHMSEIYVRVGDKVGRGQVIGRMGSTGRSTGTHLHFEVRVNGTPVDPSSFVRR
jgi:murein DD-endopeptidase MepM/ murein hydrolase activator NlpD